jgi:hypothetical protein
VGKSLSRLEVNVRGKHAKMEWVTIDGVRRGVVDGPNVGNWVRQLAYAHRTTCKAERAGSTGELWASHHPFTQIEVRSLDANRPFHLKTAANQLLAEKVEVYTRGVAGFIEAQLEKSLKKVAEEELSEVELNTTLKSDLLGRLRRMPTPGPGDSKFELQDSLQAIEVLLYSDLAVRWNLVDALPELNRLGRQREAKAIEDGLAEKP